jgi:MFS family permease
VRGGRDFRLFWAAETLSNFGSSFTLVAVPLLILDATRSVAQMGLLTGVASLASLVAGVFAGGIADRFDRKRLLVLANVAQAALLGAVPVVWLVAPSTEFLYAVVPLAAAFAMVFRVAHVTVVPQLVEPDAITWANGRIFASGAAASLAGPVLAGVVVGRFGAATAIGVDAATFAVAALGLLAVRLRPTGEARAGSPGEPGEPATPAPAVAFWRDLHVGAVFLWRHPVLRSLTVLLTALIFFWQGLVDLVIYHLKEDLGQPDHTVGTVLAMAGAGTLAGALVVARLRRRIGFGASWIGSTVLAGLAIAGLAAVEWVPAIAILTTAAYALTAVGGICSMSLRQEITPPALLGRVTSAFWTIHFALGPAGAAVLTAVAAHVGAAPVIALSGAAYALIGAVGLLTPVRSARPEMSAAALPAVGSPPDPLEDRDEHTLADRDRPGQPPQ